MERSHRDRECRVTRSIGLASCTRRHEHHAVHEVHQRLVDLGRLRDVGKDGMRWSRTLVVVSGQSIAKTRHGRPSTIRRTSSWLTM